MPAWFWSLLALALFFPVLVRLLAWFSARGLRIQPGAHRLAEKGEVPGWEREVLDGADEVLAAQGFRLAAYGWQREGLAGTPDSRFLAYYAHESLPAWAAVKTAHFPVPQCPFLIHYFSGFADGRLLWTRNMDPHSEDRYLPWVVAQDVFADSWDEAWAAHRRRLPALEAESRAERGTVEALVALRDRIEREAWQGLRGSGDAVPVPDLEGVVRLGLGASWSMARQLMSWSGALARAGKAWLKQGKTYPLSPRAEAESWQRLQRVRMDAGGWGKAVLAVASVGALALLWGSDFTWGIALAILIVLTVHEMGHALMMRWVGYRDVNIFFIPFFGAMATGNPHKTLHPWQEALVLLAGPVPGLLAGAWLVQGGISLEDGSFSTVLGSMSLILNGLNLLPIAPLDGGKLMDLILFRRAPRLGQAFLVLSAGAMGAGAAFLREPILGAVAAGTLLGSGRAYRQARMLADWRRKREEAEAEEEGKKAAEAGAGRTETAAGGAAGAASPSPAGPVEDLFRRLREEKPASFQSKAAQVKAMMGSLHTRSPGWGAAGGLLAVYACAWLAPLALMGWSYLGSAGEAEPVLRADLEAGEGELWDGLCADSAVVDLGGFRRGDSLLLTATALSLGDTARVRRLAEGLVAGKARVVLSAPAWRPGELDSALIRGIRDPWDDESTWLHLGDDSVTARLDRYQDLMDSVRESEERLWRSWSGDRRRAALGDLVLKALARGETWDCRGGARAVGRAEAR